MCRIFFRILFLTVFPLPVLPLYLLPLTPIPGISLKKCKALKIELGRQYTITLKSKNIMKLPEIVHLVNRG